MARAVQGILCIEAFPPSGLPDRWRCALKKLYSVLSLNVLLLATGALHAQTLNISPNPLNISVQANTSATAYLTLTSTGAPITIYSVTTPVSSLHASLPASPV